MGRPYGEVQFDSRLNKIDHKLMGESSVGPKRVILVNKNMTLVKYLFSCCGGNPELLQLFMHRSSVVSRNISIAV